MKRSIRRQVRKGMTKKDGKRRSGRKGEVNIEDEKHKDAG
jgi:hypothetical protein